MATLINPQSPRSLVKRLSRTTSEVMATRTNNARSIKYLSGFVIVSMFR